MTNRLVEVKDLKKYFKLKKKYPWHQDSYLKAVDDVSFHIDKGETLGIVGESGCGKSTLGKCVTNILEATEGEIIYRGVDITKEARGNLGWYRESIQAIFQDPYSSLNPTLNIYDIVAEPLRVNNRNSKEVERLVVENLDKVGIGRDSLLKKPREFSGGQRQRISIARAISTNPEFILCDEPISALDVSIQAQIVNLLDDLQKDLGLTYLFIAHDLSMVRYISNRTAVMYLGNIVEIGNSENLYTNPKHPYTKGLLDSVLDPVPRDDLGQPLETISSDLPSPLEDIEGCKFYKRCKYRKDICKSQRPKLIEVDEDHSVACFLYEKNS